MINSRKRDESIDPYFSAAQCCTVLSLELADRDSPPSVTLLGYPILYTTPDIMASRPVRPPIPARAGSRAPPVGRLASLKPTNPTPIRRPQPIARPQPAKPTTHPKTSTCPNPGCPAPHIVEDDGQKVCSGCGTVISDANIVSEVTFGETSSGAAMVQGTFVGEDQSHVRSYGPGFQRGGAMESREMTEQNGRLVSFMLVVSHANCNR